MDIMYFGTEKTFDKVFEGEQNMKPQNTPFGDTDYLKLVIFKKDSKIVFYLPLTCLKKCRQKNLLKGSELPLTLP